MACIKPFRGYIYNTEEVKDIAKVLAPPYDVISPGIQDALYKRDEFNVVRLILGKEDPGDNSAENKYKRAKTYLEGLIKKEILIRDELPCIYVYDQEYVTPAGKKNRIGFIALMKLEDPKDSKVLAHERTFMHPKRDRLRLIRQVRANLSCIFSIFVDDKNKITHTLEKETKSKPIFDVYYEDVRQRLWRISDSKVISDIKEAMKEKQIFIADGHHRYETALAFRNEMRLKAKEDLKELPYDYVMMYFASLDEAKLTILATHRVIKDVGSLTKKDIISLVQKYFKIKEFKGLKDMNAAQESSSARFSCGMYCGDGFFYLLELKDTSIAEKIIKMAKPVEWKRLDVTLLHQLILKQIFKVREKDDNIIYLRDAESAVERVKSGECKLACFLKPTKLEQVKHIAEIGERMPHKSTYFYPKLLSGIVINKFDL